MSLMTPMQQQYNQLKQQYPDAILLFRMGDFYECFDDDAERAAKILGITLTGRGKGDNRQKMAGVPYHALDTYLPKLLKAGVKVAIGEQMEEPQAGKLVEREITKVYTPGTITDDKTLDPGNNNYLASVYVDQGNFGVAFVDISTGKLQVFEAQNPGIVKSELERLAIAEVITPIAHYQQVKPISPVVPQQRDQSPFENQKATDLVHKQFQVQNLKGFGIENKTAIISALGGLLEYLEDTQKTDLRHITQISTHNFSQYMPLDLATVRNLELVYTSSGDTKFSLLGVMDACSSPMGKRKLREWILHPLVDEHRINERLDSVEVLNAELIINDNLRSLIGNMYDIERIMSRIGLSTANARELLSLGTSLEQLDDIISTIEQIDQLPLRLKHLVHQIKNSVAVGEVLMDIQQSIHPEPPVTITDGGIIQDGYNTQVDEFRSLAAGSKDILAEIQAREIKATSISSLKISYNKVFGYYIEVTKTHAHKVPETYIRKQTLANSERYITPELKELEDKILNAEEQLMQLEYNLFVEVRDRVATRAQEILAVADAVAELDVLSNFAYIARQHQYTKPEFTKKLCQLKILAGRHPVVEQSLSNQSSSGSSQFTANDIDLDTKQNLVILTGPNMSGKSTFIRQIALLTLMAQVGSFVPATKMELSIVDRIFTRVGASDNLAAGESTFMVEMNETANILNNATKNSLIILDEVGRGTSTYDGVAIAWSIVEYIHNHVQARTLFATHYHELIRLDQSLERVTNYRVEVADTDGEIEFTHLISKGSTDRSYGVHVAQLAGVPKQVIQRATKILQEFEQDSSQPQKQRKTKDTKSTNRSPRKIAPEQLGLLK